MTHSDPTSSSDAPLLAEWQLDHMLARAVSELSRFEPAPPLKFTFSWRARAFFARVESSRAGFHLMVRADLGAIPYTAEDACARECLLDLAGQHEPRSGARYLVASDGRFCIVGERRVGECTTAARIIGETTALLVNVTPMIDLALPFCVAARN